MLCSHILLNKVFIKILTLRQYLFSKQHNFILMNPHMICLDNKYICYMRIMLLILASAGNLEGGHVLISSSTSPNSPSLSSDEWIQTYKQEENVQEAILAIDIVEFGRHVAVFSSANKSLRLKEVEVYGHALRDTTCMLHSCLK